MNIDETIHQSFNDAFCLRLEHRLSQAFSDSEDKRIHGFWCDGVAMPFIEQQLLRKSINDTRMLVTKAWLGLDGQTEFEMTIHFGPKALSRCARGLDLYGCMPEDDQTEWLVVDLENRTIEIQLN